MVALQLVSTHSPTKKLAKAKLASCPRAGKRSSDTRRHGLYQKLGPANRNPATANNKCFATRRGASAKRAAFPSRQLCQLWPGGGCFQVNKNQGKTCGSEAEPSALLDLCQHMAMAQEPLSALLAHRHLCAKREQTAVCALFHGSGAAWLLIEDGPRCFCALGEICR